MNMMELIVKEYIAVVEALEQEHEINNDRIVIEREEFKQMLERYPFTTFTHKIKAYKVLNFIIHDNESYTMPYKDKDINKTVRRVIINYKTYKTLKHLYNTAVNL